MHVLGVTHHDFAVNIYIYISIPRLRSCHLNATCPLVTVLQHSKMGFSLQPAGLQDAEDITQIFQVAFKDDHIMGQFHPNTPKNLLWEQDMKVFSDMIAQGDIYGGRFTKVVDEDTG